MNIRVRKGEIVDLPQVLELIKELATYEKAPNEVTVTVQDMERDGFGKEKIFDFFIAEDASGIKGMALFYTKYSTWKGKCLFLEDIIVKESQRGKGIGAMLFEEVIKVAKERKVQRMEWQVLEWNEPALNFYKKYKATLDPEWINGKLVYEQLQSF